MNTHDRRNNWGCRGRRESRIVPRLGGDPMTTRTPEARVFRATSFLALAALACGCDTGGDSQGAASGNAEGKAEVSAEAKAGVSTGKPARSESTEVRLEARPASGHVQADVAASPTPARAQLNAGTPQAPGQAQLDLAAAQLAEASARLGAVAKGASVEASAHPTTPSLKVSKDGNTVVDAKVQAGNPSLNLGKAGTLIDANVAAGNPSLNIGGLKAPANTSASAGTPASSK